MSDLTKTFELVRQAKTGNREAMDRLLTRYYEPVLKTVRQHLGVGLRGSLESGDIVQEALLEAVQRFDKFEMQDDTALIRWLATLVQHKITGAADYHYASKRNPARVQPLEPLSEGGTGLDPGDDEPTPPERLVTAEERDLLERCMAELREDYRILLRLRLWERCSWQTIADKTGRPSAGAARMMHDKAELELLKRVAAAKSRLAQGQEPAVE